MSWTYKNYQAHYQQTIRMHLETNHYRDGNVFNQQGIVPQ